MRRILSTILDLIAWAFFLTSALILYAILNPAEAADQVTLPISPHALRHAAVVFLLAVAGALVTVAMLRKVRS